MSKKRIVWAKVPTGRYKTNQGWERVFRGRIEPIWEIQEVELLGKSVVKVQFEENYMVKYLVQPQWKSSSPVVVDNIYTL